MEKISSRKNPYIAHVRALAADGEYRRVQGEYLCDGIKTLKEAMRFGGEITSVLWKESVSDAEGLVCPRQYLVPGELFDYASTMKNSPGPLFTVRIPQADESTPIHSAIILENVQDPGNVGTVIRSAAAFSVDAVILTGDCADLYHPKTVRASMGAVFRQRVIELERDALIKLVRRNGLRLYGAALSETAEDIRNVDLSGCAVAVGSEGRGLSAAFLSLCDGEVIIPMNENSESLNAGIAASLILWEMGKRIL